jgi:ribonuclease P protein component
LVPKDASDPAPAGARTPVDLIAPGAVWLGAMVPKRWARRAVTRNAIKRQIYGVGQSFASDLPTAAHVVRLRASFDRKQFVSACSQPLKAAVRQELHQLFERSLRSPV